MAMEIIDKNYELELLKHPLNEIYNDITKENIVIIHEVLKAVISVIIPKIRIYDSTKTFIFVSLEVGPKYKKSLR